MLARSLRSSKQMLLDIKSKHNKPPKGAMACICTPIPLLSPLRSWSVRLDSTTSTLCLHSRRSRDQADVRHSSSCCYGPHIFLEIRFSSLDLIDRPHEPALLSESLAEQQDRGDDEMTRRRNMNDTLSSNAFYVRPIFWAHSLPRHLGLGVR
jgi:hypothetical protein